MQFSLQTIDQLKPLVQGFRKRTGLTQAVMAEKLGITQQSYAQIESNLHTTSVERLYTILRLLNVELSFSPTDFVAEKFTGNDDKARGNAKSLTSTYAHTAKPSRSQTSHDVHATVAQTSAQSITKKPKPNNAKPIKAWPQPLKQSDKTKW